MSISNIQTPHELPQSGHFWFWEQLLFGRIFFRLVMKVETNSSSLKADALAS
jgi:hypothetical protein